MRAYRTRRIGPTGTIGSWFRDARVVTLRVPRRAAHVLGDHRIDA